MSRLISPTTYRPLHRTLCYLLIRSLFTLHHHSVSAAGTMLILLAVFLTLVNCIVVNAVTLLCILFRQVIARSKMIRCSHRLLSCWTLLFQSPCITTLCHIVVHMLRHWSVLCLLTDTEAASRATLLDIHIEQFFNLLPYLWVARSVVGFLRLTGEWVNGSLWHTA